MNPCEQRRRYVIKQVEGIGCARGAAAREGPLGSQYASRTRPLCSPPSAYVIAMAKRFTRKEISERNTKKDTVFIIDNVVYDVTTFIDEHPGGHEVLVNVAGKDASEDFDDIGHSLDAKELMKKYQIGEIVEEDRIDRKRRQVTWDDNKTEGESSLLGSWKLPLLLGIIMTVLYSYLFA